MNYGTCRYCGQVVNLEYDEQTQEAADFAASEQCSCDEAKRERGVRKRIDAAKDRIRKIFGADAEKYGFQPVTVESLQMLDSLAELTARGFITSAAVNVRGALQSENHADLERENQGGAKRNALLPVGGITPDERCLQR